MNRYDTCTLISQIYYQDGLGRPQTTDNRADVFCEVQSVGQREFYEGGRSGLRPEMVLVLNRFEYGGERLVEYNGQSYTVYRTYIRDGSDKIELYLQRRKGQ